jgi:GDP-4-dehydro-6-deoxy-D-mannose reductase
MKKAFITGISGFAGNALARFLLETGEYHVSGTYHSDKGLASLDTIASQLSLHKVDLTKRQEIDSAVAQIKPDIVFHLAALASPAQSFTDPVLTFSTNTLGEINLLESVKTRNQSIEKIIVISSAEVYGLVASQDLPLDEETSLRPVSPYAVSKIAQDFLGLQYYLTAKLPVIRVRPFNHIGPGQKKSYAVAAFASQIALIEKDKQDPILHVGNLTARRDFTDVLDIVKAYELLAVKGRDGEVYNVGSGKSYEMSDVLSRLVALSKKEIRIEVDPDRFLPIDIPDNRADISKITRDTGWVPTISLDESLRNVLDYWRNLP